MECPICTEALGASVDSVMDVGDEDAETSALRCARCHAACHWACLRRWYQEGVGCPLCRYCPYAALLAPTGLEGRTTAECLRYVYLLVTAASEDVPR